MTEGLDVPIRAGLYNVQLFLPTGRVLQQACTIEPGQSAAVTFAEPSMVQSGFSLQEATGDASLSDLLDIAVQSRPASTSQTAQSLPVAKRAIRGFGARSFAAPRSPPAKPPSPRSARRPPRAAGAKRVDQPAGASKGPARAGSTARSSRGSASPRASYAAATDARMALGELGKVDSGKSWTELAAPPAIWGSRPGWTEAGADRSRAGAAIWRIAPDAAGHRADGARLWSLVRTLRSVELVSLPAPWRCADSGELSPIDVLVDSTIGGRAGTSVAVYDKALDGLLSYLDRGRLGAVRPMLAQLETQGIIERTIDEKRANPFAACAAAYVGLAVLNNQAQERWDAWLPNIMNWFPWLPDGAIVHARRIMLRPKNQDESAEALAALERAVQAGVPFYSAGLLLLREMLEILEIDHKRASELLALVAPIAARCDPKQMFTVLRYPETQD